MKHPTRTARNLTLPAVGLSLALATFFTPASAAADEPKTPTSRPVKKLSLTFKTNTGEAPAKSVGATSRAPTDPKSPDKGLYVAILAPDGRVGRTTKDQPTLFWYLSQPTESKVDVSINGVGKAPPTFFSQELDGVKQAGIQRLDLSTTKSSDGKLVRLEPGQEYEFTVEVEVNEKAGSGDPTARRRFRYEPAQGADKVNESDKAAAAEKYAAAGVWYDTLAALSDLIDADKGDAELIEQRRALLKSAGLDEDKPGHIVQASGTAEHDHPTP